MFFWFCYGRQATVQTWPFYHRSTFEQVYQNEKMFPYANSSRVAKILIGLSFMFSIKFEYMEIDMMTDKQMLTQNAVCYMKNDKW